MIKITEVLVMVLVAAILLSLAWMGFNHMATTVQENHQRWYQEDYEKGKLARQAGVPAEANPNRYSESRSAWLDGWIAGEE